MAFNGSGVFVRLYDWVTDKANGIKIIAQRVDDETDGIVAGLNDVVDGTQGFIGAVRGTNGTAASPAFSFTDDTNTGVYRVSADKLGFSVAGTQEMVVEAGYIDAVNGLKIGGTAVTSTAAEMNRLDGSLTTVQSNLGLAIGTDVQAYDADILKADTHDTLTAGFDSDEEDLGTVSSGTTTPEVDADTKENFKKLTNNGAFTLAPPSTSSACTIRIRVINAASAGAITTTGFDKVIDPDTYATTNAKEYFFYIDHDSARDVLTIREIV